MATRISLVFTKRLATEFDMPLIILIQFCPRASFPEGLSSQIKENDSPVCLTEIHGLFIES